MCSFMDNCGEKSSSPLSKMNYTSESGCSVINYTKKFYWYGSIIQLKNLDQQMPGVARKLYKHFFCIRST